MLLVCELSLVELAKRTLEYHPCVAQVSQYPPSNCPKSSGVDYDCTNTRFSTLHGAQWA